MGIAVAFLAIAVSYAFAPDSECNTPTELSGTITRKDASFSAYATSITVEEVLDAGYRMDDSIVLHIDGYGDLAATVTYNMAMNYPGIPFLNVYLEKEYANIGWLMVDHDFDIGNEISVSYVGHGHPEDFEKKSEPYKTRDMCARDEEFCNFREVMAGDIAPGRLYRSVGTFGDTVYSDTVNTLYEEHGIESIIALNRTEESLVQDIERGADSYAYTLFGNGHVFAGNYGDLLYLTPDDFRAVLDAVKDLDGPIGVMCQYGKDRTGQVIAFLELFMGATVDEVLDDFYASFYNINGVEKGTPEYDRLMRDYGSRIVMMICDDRCWNDSAGYGWDLDIRSVDPVECTERYMREFLGMPDSDIDAIRTKLSV